jgi:hypothetical protein
MAVENSFGRRRIYYNNFADHLLNAYNPNMLYPDLPYCWSDEDWRQEIDMLSSFGFNALEFWLVPRLFSREGLQSGWGLDVVAIFPGDPGACSRNGCTAETYIDRSIMGLHLEMEKRW